MIMQKWYARSGRKQSEYALKKGIKKDPLQIGAGEWLFAEVVEPRSGHVDVAGWMVLDGQGLGLVVPTERTV